MVRAHHMRKRFDRARLLVEAYRMSVDDLVKELGRASRRIEEKCEKVRQCQKTASAAFLKMEESRSGVCTPETLPNTPTKASTSAQQQQMQGASQKLPKSRFNAGATAGPSEKHKDVEPAENQESNESDSGESARNNVEDQTMDTAIDEAGEAMRDQDLAQDATTAASDSVVEDDGVDGIGGAEGALHVASGASRDDDSAQVDGETDPEGQGRTSSSLPESSTPSASFASDYFIVAHEELLDSIRDLEEARLVYEELVTVADALSTQKSKTVLDFCLAKHKKMSKTMEEVEVVERAVEDMFDEYDAFLEFLNN